MMICSKCLGNGYYYQEIEVPVYMATGSGHAIITDDKKKDCEKCGGSGEIEDD